MSLHSSSKRHPGLRRTMQAYFVRNTSHPAGIIQHSLRRSGTPPPPLLGPIAPPRFPDAAKASLASMQPLTFVIRFDCEQHCRSFGICVHFQFCCGVKSCPDGLICERCLGQPCELDIWARRKCPLHQKPEAKGWVPSRPEDFLATDQERERCREMLMRSTLGLWDASKMSPGCETLRSSGVKRMRADEGKYPKAKRRLVDGGLEERSLERE